MRKFLTLFLCCCSLIAASQTGNSRAELEKRRKDILEAIRLTQEQLELIKKDKTASLTELRALQNKLSERQRLIGNINQEISSINQNISASAQEVSLLRNNLGQLKARYAQSVRYAYKHRSSYNMLAFLFSANDFNTAVRRLRYLKQYRDYRKQQAQEIRKTQSTIEMKIGELNNVKAQKDLLLSAEEQQRQVMERETNEKNRVVTSLKGREKELSADIKKNIKASKQVDQSISRLIQREIEIARKKAEEEEKRRRIEEEKQRLDEQKRLAAAAAAARANSVNVATGSGTRPAVPGSEKIETSTPKTSPPPAAETPAVAYVPKTTPKSTASYISNLTPEAAALSNSFESNHGRLPYPVEKGYISLGFGNYQHPTESKVTLENYGVTISTNPGAAARSVFEGKVTSSQYIDGAGWVVLISHGQFFTVYSGLSSVSVKRDDQVRTKQNIGLVGVNDDGATQLNFQIWKVGKNNQSSKLNPADWLAR